MPKIARRVLRKATGRPPQQTEEAQRMSGTITGSVELVAEFPEGQELALSELGQRAAEADTELDAGIARLQAINTRLCPED